MLVRCEKYERDTSGSTAALICLAYLRGFGDAIIAAGDRNLVICLPSHATAGQLARVFIAYARARPQYLHEHANKLVVGALQAAFPCEPPR